ncbi:MSMEG_1061 family FMN-dependent PPOX-type flavoprotein [Palleronia sp. KMU-117]|uniref:MSMEG_1061 family FMN-dependent PPOX-type flavoprotein n=1 Tax=Palleronia sp. KMU-117 TaxID=3434108 RepID=UPI003D719601
MEWIETPEGLAALYGAPKPTSLGKVVPVLTPAYRRWIEASRFAVLSTIGPEGTDASPRGYDGPVVRVDDPRTLVLPDWRGNDRIDSLRNIVADGRVSLMFFVPGSTNVVRVNGTARVTADAGLLASFGRGGALPRSAVVVRVAEVYFQCARAILRAGLWSGRDDSPGLPTAGDFLREATDGGIDGAAYDAEWAARAAASMW